MKLAAPRGQADNISLARNSTSLPPPSPRLFLPPCIQPAHESERNVRTERQNGTSEAARRESRTSELNVRGRQEGERNVGWERQRLPGRRAERQSGTSVTARREGRTSEAARRESGPVT